MKKQKELERIKEGWMIVAVVGWIFFIFTLGVSMYVFETEGHPVDLKQQLSECQEDVYCDDSFKEMMSKSCLIGCIYSTKFYYDNPRVDFWEASYDCMLNCLEKAQEFSFCEVIE